MLIIACAWLVLKSASGIPCLPPFPLLSTLVIGYRKALPDRHKGSTCAEPICALSSLCLGRFIKLGPRLKSEAVPSHQAERPLLLSQGPGKEEGEQTES